MSSIGNSVISDSLLPSDPIFVVRLCSLKNCRPLQMVMTTATVESIDWYTDLSLLRESALSFRVESHTPPDGDESAATLTRGDGA